MADWTDGPEYAPRERPDGFAASGAAPLAVAERPAPAASEPVDRPDFGTPSAAVPLEQLSAPAKDQRDPREAFAVVSTPLTSPAVTAAAGVPTAFQPLTLSTQAAPAAPSPAPQAGSAPQAWPAPQGSQASAWGSAHAAYGASAGPRPVDVWAPQQPLALPTLPPVNLPPTASGMPAPQVNPQGFPTQDAGQWHVPDGYQHHPAPAPGPVTSAALIDAINPAVVGALLIGGLASFIGLGWLAPPMFAVALAVAGQRTRYRRASVRRAFWGVGASAIVLSLLSLADGYSPDLWTLLDSLSGWAQLACWVMIPVLMLIVGGALRRGERPER